MCASVRWHSFSNIIKLCFPKMYNHGFPKSWFSMHGFPIFMDLLISHWLNARDHQEISTYSTLKTKPESWWLLKGSPTLVPKPTTPDSVKGVFPLYLMYGFTLARESYRLDYPLTLLLTLVWFSVRCYPDKRHVCLEHKVKHCYGNWYKNVLVGVNRLCIGYVNRLSIDIIKCQSLIFSQILEKPFNIGTWKSYWRNSICRE